MTIHSMLRRTGTMFGIAAVMALGVVNTASALEIDEKAQEIIDRSVDVTLGDLAAEQGLVSTKAHVTITDSIQGLNMSIVIYLQDGNMLTDMNLPGLGSMKEGVTDGVAWGFSELQGPAIKDGVEASQSIQQADFYADRNLDKYYSTVSYEGITTISTIGGDSLDAQTLVFTPLIGEHAETRYYDPETGLLMMTSAMVAVPGGGMIPSSLRLGDYRTIDGMTAPFLTLAEVGPSQMVLTVDSMAINPEIDAAIFALPEEVAAMTTSEE